MGSVTARSSGDWGLTQEIREVDGPRSCHSRRRAPRRSNFSKSKTGHLTALTSQLANPEFLQILNSLLGE